MQLKISRSQRSGGMIGGKVIFVLDARTDLSADEQALAKKYGLGKLVVYDSKARRQHQSGAVDQFDDAVGASSATRSLWKSARGLASAAMAALSLRVTVDSLTRGEHVECKDMDELLGAEAAIVEACQNLKTYLDTAQTFDGREEVIEF